MTTGSQDREGYRTQRKTTGDLSEQGSEIKVCGDRSRRYEIQWRCSRKGTELRIRDEADDWRWSGSGSCVCGGCRSCSEICVGFR